jgi:hypothetical protein
MRYTADRVQRLVAEARALSSRQWVPGQIGDVSAIRQARAHFDACLIFPEVGTIKIEPHVSTFLKLDAGTREVWFVTKMSSQRIFFDESANAFGVAWGPDDKSGDYIDLGFRTDDPIDAFLA